MGHSHGLTARDAATTVPPESPPFWAARFTSRYRVPRPASLTPRMPGKIHCELVGLMSHLLEDGPQCLPGDREPSLGGISTIHLSGIA